MYRKEKEVYVLEYIFLFGKKLCWYSCSEVLRFDWRTRAFSQTHINFISLIRTFSHMVIFSYTFIIGFILIFTSILWSLRSISQCLDLLWL